MSPNARSAALLEAEGFMVDVVERRIARAITRDLLGVVDIVRVKDGATLAIQATTAPNLAARRKKLEASRALPVLRATGWRVELHRWRNARGWWACKREVLT